MGILDNSTNNIILDAVLTDKGREVIAKNEGFTIVKFALGDDEVDYTNIVKYGRAVGAERIEKITPIFEAITNGNQAQKYRLISISNPNLTRLPSLSLTGDIAFSIVSLTRSTQTLANVTVSQAITQNELIPVDLIDTTYEVRVNSLFLQIDGQRPDSFDIDNTAIYNITRGAGTTTSASGGTSVTLGIRLRSIPSATFSTYASTVGTNSYIRTFIRVTGLNSGAVAEFEARIY
jgi:hypothetical protein